MTPHEAIEQGFRLHQAGRLAEAEPFYAAALKAQPDFFPAMHLTGILRYHQRDFAAAHAFLERALRQQPDAAETLMHLGLVLAALGSDADALAMLERATKAARPGESLIAIAFAQRGEILMAQQRAREAVAEFDKALAADPSLAAVWNNRGLALNALKQHEAALASFDRAAALSPASIEIHNNRGDTLREMRRHEDALASFDRALSINPDDWATRNNRAIALTFMGRIDEALADYDRALGVEPNIAQALHARGNLLWSHKANLPGAIADLERLVKVAPDFAFAPGSLMRLKLFACDWDGYDAQKAALDDGVRAGRPVIEPFIYLALSNRSDDLLRCARIYGQAKFPAQQPLWRGGARRPGKIRIGYVCGEFRTHATLYLMAGLFEAHDKAQFEIFAFDNGGGDGSALRARFEAAVDKIVDIRALSDMEAAAQIKALEIDVLVDLNGYSGNQRAGIFSHRPAPVQAGYLAYPGTLGGSSLDYIIADPVVIPKTEQIHYSEKIAWLPHSYQVNDNKRVIAAQRPSRAEEGLPQDGFVFCNFNHANKFTPEIFSLWMGLLTQIAGSVLWLLKPHPVCMDNLRQQAARHGIAPERLIFADTVALEKHLARMALADLFLDGLPYGAHTTASDALWAGLPLITCRGSAFAGRVAASLLRAVELPELVTENLGDYEMLALRLAREHLLLDGFRKKLAQNRLTTPLFDTAKTTRHIEAAYRQMVASASPESFMVPEN